jgi:hypothetical protein
MSPEEIRQLLAAAGLSPEDVARYVPAAQLMSRMDPALVRQAILESIERNTDE